jgi:phosphoribosylamine--glycine ligase
VIGTGPSLPEARDEAYRKVSAVHLAGSHHRTDIALKAAQGATTAF